MATSNFTRVLQGPLKGVLKSDSRYRAENIAVIVAFVFLSLASIGWAISGSDDSDALGAEVYLRDVVVGFDLAVENAGSRDWTEVRIVLDKKYLYTTDRIEGNEHRAIGHDQLQYAYYIPRPWGREEWEELARVEKPARQPAEDYVPSFVQIRSNQGRVDAVLDARPEE